MMPDGKRKMLVNLKVSVSRVLGKDMIGPARTARLEAVWKPRGRYRRCWRRSVAGVDLGKKEELPKKMKGSTKVTAAALPSRVANCNWKCPSGRGDHGSKISFGFILDWILFILFLGLIRSFGSLQRDNK